MAIWVGSLASTARSNRSQSNSPTRLTFLVTDVISTSDRLRPDRFATSSQVISPCIGPLFPPTRIGYVLITIMISSTDRGEIPASEMKAAAVVSLDVQNG